jgi:hypothetical protein
MMAGLAFACGFDYLLRDGLSLRQISLKTYDK